MTRSEKINILIPLGGAGKRFTDRGYQVSKPFIDVDGETMIRSVVNNLKHENSHFIFIINEQSIGLDDFKQHIQDLQISFTIYATPSLTEGPACSVLLAKEEIDTDVPLIVVNCDQIILDFNLENLLSFSKTHGCDGILGCFLSSSKKNSYVRLDPNGEISEVKEKIVISNIATNGLHYWKRGSLFVRSATQMIACGDRYNNEFYVAPSYNYLIKEGKKILPFFYNLHFPIGTPEDLQTYLDVKRNANI